MSDKFESHAPLVVDRARIIPKWESPVSCYPLIIVENINSL